jgi:DNA-binding transcriptional LysR family regulator
VPQGEPLVTTTFGLRQLRYFVVAAEEGQITRAAQKLNLAQPALSRTIAQLEAQMGVKLLQRHARGVSLTPAGEELLGKAQAVLDALADVERMSQSLARSTRGAAELGFLGTSPMIDAPELITAFSTEHPEFHLSYRQLSFPRGSTAEWIADVDVGLCFAATPHPDICLETVRSEPRVVLAAASHPLARREQLTLADVLDAKFCGTDPGLEPVRAGFWRFDDHRGGPAPHVTEDRATNPFEIAAVVATGAAIATTPASNAAHALRALTNVVAIPVVDAHPAVLSLIWHDGKESQLIEALLATARRLRDEQPGGRAAGGGASDPVPSGARGTARGARKAVSGP